MKSYEREEARRLRREQGLSVKEICKVLGVAKSSVSLWVRDIELTDEQRKVLSLHRPHEVGKHKGAIANRNKGLAQRRQYQEEGRVKARERDALHLAGCMLYWAEGAKSRNVLKFVNSDPEMIIFYVKFLREAIKTPNEEIAIRIHCYTNNNISAEDISLYWLKLLKLPQHCLKGMVINEVPRSSKQRGRKLLYGLCEVYICSTKLVQNVFGAIQEYAGIEKPEWLF